MYVGRRQRPLGVLAACAALLVTGGGAPQPPLAFSTHGGEAWTFQKRIELSLPDGACDAVMLASPAATLVEQARAGQVMASIPLMPGDNTVTAECLKDGRRRGSAISQHWQVRLRDAPRAHLRVSMGEDGISVDAGASKPAESRPVPVRRYEWRLGEGLSAPAPLAANSARMTMPAPADDGEYTVSVTITDDSGRTDRASAMFRIEDGKARPLDAGRESPAWIGDAVVYGIMLPAFDKPKLAAVAARLGLLQALGINTLWLSPVTASPPADFGYAVTDHFALRADIGIEAELRALVDAAHTLNMRVILDFVPNHLSDHHDYYIDVDRHGRASPYFDFFARTSSGAVANYFDWRNLKNLNYDNPEVRRMMTEAFAYWVRKLDIDGFRVDAAWGPRERAPEFWPRLTDELRRMKPDLLLLAEASARDGYYAQSGFDAAYDWTESLGVWSWSEAFSGGGNVAGRLRDALASQEDSEAGRVFRFINNNDTGARFVTRHGAAKTRVAAAMLLTLPGIPSLYTGDEVGAELEPYNLRSPIRWEDAHGLRPWYTALIRLRRELPVLRSGELRLLDPGAADQVLAYLRPGRDQNDDILVLLNFGIEPAEFAIPSSENRLSRSTFKDLLDGTEIGLTQDRSIPLAAHGVRILRAR